jgi:transporter family protein
MRGGVMSGGSWFVYSLLCLLFWGLWGVMLKIAYAKLSWVQAYMLSYITSFIIVVIVIAYFRPKITGLDYSVAAALLAGFFGSVGYLFFVKALEIGKASIVIPLTAIYPAITAIIAAIFLHEKPSIYQWIGIVLAVAAVILLSLK